MIEFLNQPSPTWLIVTVAALCIGTAIYAGVLALNWTFNQQHEE